jgi:hypothetical protein
MHPQDEQIKLVEQTKLSAKKRRGVAPFIKNFPTYVNRVEAQLTGADDMEIRGNVDAAYDRIVQAMFDCLKQMAKLEGEQGEDKGQLNYHVILVGEQNIGLYRRTFSNSRFQQRTCSTLSPRSLNQT